MLGCSYKFFDKYSQLYWTKNQDSTKEAAWNISTLFQLYPWESLHIYFYFLHKKSERESEELFRQCFWFTQFWWAKTHRFTHSIIELAIFSPCMWSCLIDEFIEWYIVKQIFLKKKMICFMVLLLFLEKTIYLWGWLLQVRENVFFYQTHLCFTTSNARDLIVCLRDTLLLMSCNFQSFQFAKSCPNCRINCRLD